MTTRSIPLRFLRRSWDTLSLTVVVAGALAAALPLSRIAGWIPRIVLLATLALLVVQLALEYREVNPEGDGPERERLPPIRPTGPVVVVGWVAGLMLTVLVFGTVVGSALFCLAYLRLHSRENWRSSGAVALTLAAVVYLVFVALLGAQLHEGWFAYFFE